MSKQDEVVAYLCRFDGSVHRRGVHHPGDEPLIRIARAEAAEAKVAAVRRLEAALRDRTGNGLMLRLLGPTYRAIADQIDAALTVHRLPRHDHAMTAPSTLTCDCGKLARHTKWQAGVTSRLCCSCYIAGGGTPADWHADCMTAAAPIEGVQS